MTINPDVTLTIKRNQLALLRSAVRAYASTAKGNPALTKTRRKAINNMVMRVDLLTAAVAAESAAHNARAKYNAAIENYQPIQEPPQDLPEVPDIPDIHTPEPPAAITATVIKRPI